MKMLRMRVSPFASSKGAICSETLSPKSGCIGSGMQFYFFPITLPCIGCCHLPCLYRQYRCWASLAEQGNTQGILSRRINSLCNTLPVISEYLQNWLVKEYAQPECIAICNFKRSLLNADVFASFCRVWSFSTIPYARVQTGIGDIKYQLTEIRFKNNECLFFSIGWTTDFESNLGSTSRINLQVDFKAISGYVFKLDFYTVSQPDVSA